MPATKKGKLQVKVCQVDGTEWVNTLWPMKFFPVVGVNPFFLNFNFSQENEIASDYCNNIVVITPTDDIILDHWSKTHDAWDARVDFFCKANNDRAASATTLPKINVNSLHVELGCLSNTTTWATAKAFGS